MSQLPPNLIDAARELAAIIQKTQQKKRLTKAEQNLVDEYARNYAEQSAYSYVTNQTQLANECGVDRRTITNWAQKPGCPGKEFYVEPATKSRKEGYCVQKWQAFGEALGAKSLHDYAHIFATGEVTLDANAAHEALQRDAQTLQMRQKAAEDREDRSSEAFFRKECLEVLKLLRQWEDTIRKHNIETGELIPVAEMEKAESMIREVCRVAMQATIDELTIQLEICDSARQFRQAVGQAADHQFRKAFKRALAAEALDPRVIDIWSIPAA